MIAQTCVCWYVAIATSDSVAMDSEEEKLSGDVSDMDSEEERLGTGAPKPFPKFLSADPNIRSILFSYPSYDLSE